MIRKCEDERVAYSALGDLTEAIDLVQGVAQDHIGLDAQHSLAATGSQRLAMAGESKPSDTPRGARAQPARPLNIAAHQAEELIAAAEELSIAKQRLESSNATCARLKAGMQGLVDQQNLLYRQYCKDISRIRRENVSMREEREDILARAHRAETSAAEHQAALQATQAGADAAQLAAEKVMLKLRLDQVLHAAFITNCRWAERTWMRVNFSRFLSLHTIDMLLAGSQGALAHARARRGCSPG